MAFKTVNLCKKGLSIASHTFYMCLGNNWLLVPLVFFQKHGWLVPIKNKETEVPLMHCYIKYSLYEFHRKKCSTPSLCNQIHFYENYFQEISFPLILELQSENRTNASNLLQFQYENVSIFSICQQVFYHHISKVCNIYDEAEHVFVGADFSKAI